ncbi:MAG: S-layer homology domain-containing protein [Thermoanaerobaculia bacterium]
MAVFLLKSRFGSAYVPNPATGLVFTDVPASNPFAPWIESLAALNITGGCGGGLYCPDSSVTRQQMAVFLLKTKNGSTCVPPPGSGIFGDVACPSVFCDFIEDLYNQQITGGCQAAPLLYCPGNPVLRQQMAVFLVKTFGLSLYGN